MLVSPTFATSRKILVTITLPSINVGLAVTTLRKSITELLSTIYNPINNSISQATEGATSRAKRVEFPRMKKNNFHFNKKYLKIILPIFFGAIVIAAIFSLIRSLPDAQSRPVADSASQVVAPNALATINLDRKFSFPLKDDKGVAVGNFDYVIQSAAIQKQIIVQGQRATAVNGRDFLILNLKITNNLKKTIQLNTRDYIRLTTASDSKEQLAPDIHNDPVEVQAISTKFTRVGVALDESDVKKTIHLKVGEIDGSKQNIDLNFKF